MITRSFGALAQLVERNNGIVEANGSTPLRSIYPSPKAPCKENFLLSSLNPSEYLIFFFSANILIADSTA
jgi:hypothetical protein